MIKYIAAIAVLLAGVLTAAFFISTHATQTKPLQHREVAKVVRVIDGDTITIDYHGTPTQVRFIGMNTPEIADSPKGAEYYGDEAAERTKQLVEGKSVTIDTDGLQGDRDRYGRLLRYVYVGNQQVNLTLIQEGYAYDWTDRYPSVYQKQFHKAETDAQKQKRGLWAKCY